MPSEPNEIATTARDITSTYGAITSGTRLTRNMRDDLRLLARMCGLSREVGTQATDADLIGIYRVATANPEAAQRTAAKVQARFVTSPVFDDPEPAPAPSKPREPVRFGEAVDLVDANALRAEMADALKLALSKSLDRMDKIERDTLDGLSRVRSDLTFQLVETGAEIQKSVLDAVRDHMRLEAATAVADALKSMTPTRLDVSVGAAPVVSLGLVHRETERIIQTLAAGLNVYLHGPAGSGKTTCARKCAEAFGLQFYFAAKVESEYQLLGFTDAKGEAVRTQFREAYEHGGVFLFDEMDASSAAAVVALNAALANGICPFPDAIVTRHGDFHCIGAGNTKLTGASRAYAGRNKLDAASIDRFAFIEFGYDDDLERALATDQTWCAYVQDIRAKCAKRGIDHLVTPRATYDGCKLLAAGFDFNTVADMCIFKGLDADTAAQIR